MQKNRRELAVRCATLFAVLSSTAVVHRSAAEVVRIEIERREPFAGGHSFGKVGPYERIVGRVYYEVDPDDPHHARITDLKRAPRNSRGKVEFWSDVFILKPADLGKGNGRLLYDVHNRGNKLALWTFNEATTGKNDPTTRGDAGNGFLMERGYTIVWSGWNGDIADDGTNRLLAGLPIARDGERPITGRSYVEICTDEPVLSRPFFYSPWGTSVAYPAVRADNSGATLTMRPRRSEPAIEIPRRDWAFARWEEGKVVPDRASLYVKAGFRPGWIYELVYTAQDPRVSGLGLAGLRDLVSFLRFGRADREGVDNPLEGMIERAYIFGISQSGRLTHHFLHEGFNLDCADRVVFDGALIHVAGAGRGLFNHRFGMATVYGTGHTGGLFPTDSFPFAPVRQTDPVTGRTGDSFSRLRARGAVPKVFFVQTSTEYWTRAASLLHTDVQGKRDLKLDPNVRIYLIAGAHHLGAGPATRGICQNPRNTLRHRPPILRALLVALDRWASGKSDPPPSRHPRIDNGTLVDVAAFRTQFPRIPGVTLPSACYAPMRLDLGPRWESEGIADIVPPKVGPPFRTLVPAVDADGNELAGIRLPEVAVPWGTYTGWNLRASEYGAEGALAGLFGSYLAFPATEEEREKTGDPRRAVSERYRIRAAYVKRVNEVVEQLKRERLLLPEDAMAMTEEAAEAIDSECRGSVESADDWGSIDRRWVYLQINLQVAANVERAAEVMRRAAAAGYNGIVLADFKLSVLHRVPQQYFRHMARVKELADELKLELIPCVAPIGYSGGILDRNPNLAEGMPVRDVPLVVGDGVVRLETANRNLLPGGQFEQHRRHAVGGWTYQDNPGKTSFVDTRVKHSGHSSLRFEGLGSTSGVSKNGRVSRIVTVSPWRQYHASIWIKTEDYDAASRVRMFAMGADGRVLSYSHLGVKANQDWTQHHVVFNSLENEQVRFYCGTWNGGGGRLWMDDARLEETAFVNLLRRPGCPLVVTTEDGRVLKEGKDFARLVDSKLGKSPLAGNLNVYHEPPLLKLSRGARVRDGERLRVSFYHSVSIHNGQVVCCLAADEVFEIIEDQIRRIDRMLEPKTYFLSHDEIRVANSCDACRRPGRSAGELLAGNVRRCVEIVRKVSPDAQLCIWSDMFDPHHNARDSFYLVNGDLAGSWEGLPQEMIVVNWNRHQGAKSLPWFGRRGHVQVLAGYYDSLPLRIAEWLEQGGDTSGISGVMYTTWRREFEQLEEFAEAVREHSRGGVSRDRSSVGR